MRCLAAILLTPLLLGMNPAKAQVCVGDCNGDGAVSIADLITAVNISLGATDVSACAAADRDGNGQVSIAELVAAVGNGLRGCPPTPTPEPSATATAQATVDTTETPTPTGVEETPATATPSATATRTGTFPDVSGLWLEETLALASSTCLETFAVEFAAELARRPPCLHDVSSDGPAATVVDCNERVLLGEVDLLGRITYALPDEFGEESGCTVLLTTTVRVATDASPAVASYFFEIVFGGTCPLDSCSLTATAPWTPQSDG